MTETCGRCRMEMAYDNCELQTRIEELEKENNKQKISIRTLIKELREKTEEIENLELTCMGRTIQDTQLTKERDEARREYCEEAAPCKDLYPYELASELGWDCYEDSE